MRTRARRWSGLAFAGVSWVACSPFSSAESNAPPPAPKSSSVDAAVPETAKPPVATSACPKDQTTTLLRPILEVTECPFVLEPPTATSVSAVTDVGAPDEQSFISYVDVEDRGVKYQLEPFVLPEGHAIRWVHVHARARRSGTTGTTTGGLGLGLFFVERDEGWNSSHRPMPIGEWTHVTYDGGQKSGGFSGHPFALRPWTADDLNKDIQLRISFEPAQGSVKFDVTEAWVEVCTSAM